MAAPRLPTLPRFDHATMSLSSSSSTGIDEFGTNKVDNSKIEDIYIDLDGDGINDLSYADPIQDKTKDAQNKKKNKKNDDTDSSSNIMDATTDSADSDIIKF